LKELKRRSPVLIKCSDFSIDDKTFANKRLEGIDQDWIIAVKDRSVAREEVYVFARFERKRSVPVELHLVEPIPDRQLWDSERHHWFNEIAHGWNVLFHPLFVTQPVLALFRLLQEEKEAAVFQTGKPAQHSPQAST
jgi:hypothetical protein